MQTDIYPFAHTSYYSDNNNPSVTQCTGDAFEYATSGTWADHNIPNTDPYLGDHNHLAVRRVMYYEEPNQTAATAALRHRQAQTSLQFAIYPYQPCPGDLDDDKDVDFKDYAVLSQRWFESECTDPNWCAGADLNHSGTVDSNDLDRVTDCWLCGH
jgi:hypothetical protein